jgi:hypothetical protein
MQTGLIDIDASHRPEGWRKHCHGVPVVVDERGVAARCLSSQDKP